MKLKEAYEILELDELATPEEAKKKYRKLVTKMHPDVNKEPNAEEKFKKINEAYQCIQNGSGNEREYEQQESPWSNFPFTNPFSSNPFQSQKQQRRVFPVHLNLEVSFKDSVLGCKKDIKFTRQSKCKKCDGDGQEIINKCKKCQGKGVVFSRQGNVMFQTTCPDCKGKVETKNCPDCSAKGTISTDITANIKIPGGVFNSAVLRLEGLGNYAGSFSNFMSLGTQDQYTDVLVTLSIPPESGLSIEGSDVVSHLDISLLDAISGSSHKIKTVLGDKEIQIPPSSKNKDEVIIPNHGVSQKGNQRVILNISYPNDLTKLIETLKEIN